MLEDAMASLGELRSEKAAELSVLKGRVATVADELRRIDKAMSTLDPTLGVVDESFAEKIERHLTERGPMTKAELAAKIGGPRSRTSYALGVLLKAGKITPTGTERERSQEYALATIEANGEG